MKFFLLSKKKWSLFVGSYAVENMGVDGKERKYRKEFGRQRDTHQKSTYLM